MKKVLKDLKVLDLSRVLAGPYATMLLADFGADVIKLEQPGIGDDSRHFSPMHNNESAYFMSINRNKRSITIDLKKPEGKEIFLKLIKQVDVLVENFRPGTMEKLGLGYEALSEINPKLIYACVSGFGHTGPYSKRPAYDSIIQAMGGIMSITGEKGGHPVKVGASIADIFAGVFCALGILMAYIHKEDKGVGQLVDVSMLDSLVAVLENAISRYLVTGNMPEPTGNTHMSIFPFESFETKDNDIMITAGNDVLWGKLCNAIGRPELIHDERFISNPLRGQNRDDMYKELSIALKEKSAEEWEAILDDSGVPCSSICSIDKVVKNPQLISRNMLVEIQHPTAGRTIIPGIPIKMEKTPGGIEKASPILGADTSSILKTLLKLNEEDIEELRNLGVV